MCELKPNQAAFDAYLDQFFDDPLHEYLKWCATSPTADNGFFDHLFTARHINETMNTPALRDVIGKCLERGELLFERVHDAPEPSRLLFGGSIAIVSVGVYPYTIDERMMRHAISARCLICNTQLTLYRNVPTWPTSLVT